MPGRARLDERFYFCTFFFRGGGNFGNGGVRLVEKVSKLNKRSVVTLQVYVMFLYDKLNCYVYRSFYPRLF